MVAGSMLAEIATGSRDVKKVWLKCIGAAAIDDGKHRRSSTQH